MVKRLPLLLTLLLAGCPDDIGGGVTGGVTGLLAPTQLAGVSNGGSEILLTWNDRSTGETGYRVEMNFGPFGTSFIGGVEYLPADATSMAFPAWPNSTYYFRVFAITDVMESDASKVIVVSTPNVPERPTNVVASLDSITQITLKWSDVSGETGYRVEIFLVGGAGWVAGPSVGAGVTQCPVAGLIPESEYLFRVVATSAEGDSTPSLSVHAATKLVSLSVASGVDTGTFSSYVRTPAGIEHLSHVDVANMNVLVTTKSLSSTYQTATVDGGPTGTERVGGDGTSLAVDDAGKVHIVAHDQSNDRLRYITNESGAWVAVTVEFSPIKPAAGARPRIVWDTASSGLFVFHYGSPHVGPPEPTLMQISKAGPFWTFQNPVPVKINPAATFSVAVDSLGTRHVVLVSQASELWHFRQSGSPAGINPVYQLDPIPLPSPAPVPDVTAIAVTGSALHLLFHDALSGSLHHSTNVTGMWVTETVDSGPGRDLGRFCAVAIHPPTGRLHAAYYDATNRDLKYARKDPGEAWVRKVLDAGGDVGSHVSMAVDVAGAVHIAYRDETNRRLKIATGTP